MTHTNTEECVKHALTCPLQNLSLSKKVLLNHLFIISFISLYHMQCSVTGNLLLLIFQPDAAFLENYVTIFFLYNRQ